VLEAGQVKALHKAGVPCFGITWLDACGLHGWQCRRRRTLRGTKLLFERAYGLAFQGFKQCKFKG